MKTKITITTVLILIAILIGCSSNTKASGSGSGNNSTCVYVSQDGYSCQVHIIKVRGHEYLLSFTTSSYGGTNMIHAAHCSCHLTNK